MRRDVLGVSIVVSIAAAAWGYGCASGGDDDSVTNRRRAGGGGAGSGGGLVDDGRGGDSAAVPKPPGGDTGGAGGTGVEPPDDTLPSDPITIDDCASGALPQATVTALRAGGVLDPAMKWLYPYDQTVFPGGTLPPVLQWAPQSGGADAVYVHMKSQLFEYEGCFGRTTPARLELPKNVWAAATAQSLGGADTLAVELTTMAGSVVSGPIREEWTIALGSLKGAVYYNTYTSPQVGSNGAVMKILPGAASPSPFLVIPGISPVGPCISCHSVSANGAVIAAQTHFYPGGLVQSQAYDLIANPQPNPNAPAATSKTDDWGFSAVYPDGSRLLTDGSPGVTGGIFPLGTDNVLGMTGPRTSVMYDTKTGAVLPVQGLDVKYAKMPMFSPDGKKIVFNDHDHGQGHSLIVMDFDAATNTFSNRTTIFQDPLLYPGWPFFTPDSRAVVFVLGDFWGFSSITGPIGGAVKHGNLHIVELAGNAVASLDRANGRGVDGQSYLPYPGRDEDLNFYPTVSPVAAGGYFWVFFTSRRNYGNTLVGLKEAPQSKKIWVSAIDIRPKPGGDRSHPAFYLPGQEIGSGNIRAFATLDSCHQDSASCSSGVDCCSGFCTSGVCGPPQDCAETDEKCATTADCCHSSEECINGFCAQVAVPR